MLVLALMASWNSLWEDWNFIETLDFFKQILQGCFGLRMAAEAKSNLIIGSLMAHIPFILVLRCLVLWHSWPLEICCKKIGISQKLGIWTFTEEDRRIGPLKDLLGFAAGKNTCFHSTRIFARRRKSCCAAACARTRWRTRRRGPCRCTWGGRGGSCRSRRKSSKTSPTSSELKVLPGLT